MSVISIDLPDDVSAQLTAAICTNYNYATNGVGVKQSDFVNSQIVGWVMNQIDAANQAAANQAANKARADSMAAVIMPDPSKVLVTVK